MKKIFPIFLAAGILLACNAGSNKAGEPAAENHDSHGGKATGLVLNNGAKWKADSITVLNVTLLRNTIKNAQKESPDDFPKTAALLQDGLNKMVAECKMQGPDHDALHQWLEPLMEKVKALGKETAAPAAKEKLGDIAKHLDLFAQYFE